MLLVLQAVRCGNTIRGSDEFQDVDDPQQRKFEQSPSKSHVNFYQEGRDPEAYFRWTPLDFISRDEWFCSLTWRYYTAFLIRLRNIVYNPPRRAEPSSRIPDDKFLKITHVKLEWASGIVMLCYFAIFISAWNADFPSQVERLLWRIAGIYHVFYSWVGGLDALYWNHVDSPGGKPRDLPSHHARPGPGSENAVLAMVERVAAKVRNISIDGDPQLEVSLRMLIPTTVICVVYCLFRAFILIEDFIGLRSLPATAYDTVSWANYLPHF
jgi:hypothetical protein